MIKSSVIFGHYEQMVDRESAYEIIKSRATTRQDTESDMAAPRAETATGDGMMDVLGGMLLGKTGPRGGRHPGILDAAAKSAARSIGSQVGREIFRGVLGGIFGGGRRR